MAKCPSCDAPLTLSAIPMDQEKVSLRIEWEGAHVEAKTVAGLIENTRKLLASAAKDAGCGDYSVFMHGIDWGEQEASFHFLLIRKPRKQETPR